jgi:hypothetical protein
MPSAVVSTATEKFDLKTAPPDGFVELKRMSYGQIIERRSMMKMGVDMGRKKTDDIKGELTMANKAVSQFEFRTCIVGHNLTDEEERPLNFANPADLALLDPKIGQEIEKRISEMNNFEEDEEDEIP